MITKTISDKFVALFGSEGALYASPGRINIIGEHTDYNGGFVLPGAIDKAMFAMIALNGTKQVNLFSIDLNQHASFCIDSDDAPAEGWAKYIYGVCKEMQKRGYAPGGFDAVFAGNVPLGAGLSSSAALESVFVFALDDLHHFGIDKKEMVKIGQMTEHNYVGVKCGIMDQFASLFGKEGHLIKLDCSNMAFEYVPFNPTGYKLFLVDSVVKHALVGSPYNDRRLSCERAAAAVNKRYPDVHFMCQATMEQLNEVKGEISDEDFNRAEYAVGEAVRLRTACEAMTQGDFETVGKMMYGTHWGMSKLYEVSCDELDFLASFAEENGVSGSRIMGGGFGGCTINICKDELYEAFIAKVVPAFAQKYGHEPKVYDVVISNGARKMA